MAETIYVLCTLTSLACAILLWRGYRASRARLLLWCALCFLGLALNNVLLFVDLVLLPNMDLSVPRAAEAVVALSILLYGLTWDSEPTNELAEKR